MHTRREFLKKTAFLAGATGLSGILPPSIQKALAIDPAEGTTYLDAEHVVLLMLENRSFDHCFGTLRGVRGFDDPRAIRLPNGHPVWLQQDMNGHTYAPFRLNIHDSKSTWMGDLPHGRDSQVDAYNRGRHDKWLDAKRSSHAKFKELPLTMGYYNREDLPFNYALADAFTLCDQNFSSGMTCTHPNRLFFWTGTIRDPRYPASKAYIRNPDLKTGKETWLTFPERLEENGVSWKFYQNDLACGGGFEDDERAWLSNFNCNPLEFFPRYKVKFSERNQTSLRALVKNLPAEIRDLEKKMADLPAGSQGMGKMETALQKKKQALADATLELHTFSRENFEGLTQKEKNLYNSAFVINSGDPDFRKLETVDYEEQGQKRSFKVPQGDLFHQFREDVMHGKLPTVSWLAAPHYFSDHPSKPMHGPWYISEILDILTHNEEVWKKTIFIVTYDENDGYFDHIPPFTIPDVGQPDAGKCSEGIDREAEYIHLEQELALGIPKKEARGGSIGLGYRVPLYIASPWSRGGNVCSQVFDHTSSLMFLETFLNKKFGLNIREENISAWRRAICGDLTAAFTPFSKSQKDTLPFLDRDAFIETIHKAQYKPEPIGYHLFSAEEIEQVKLTGSSPYLARQEPGQRRSCALPYELYADAELNRKEGYLQLTMEAATAVFGNRAVGAPFSMYAMGNYRLESGADETMKNWQYTVKAGDVLTDRWPLEAFKDQQYHLCLYGPNGFYRQLKGGISDPFLQVRCLYEKGPGETLSGNVILDVSVHPGKEYTVEIADLSYGKENIVKPVSGHQTFKIDLSGSHGWYDLRLTCKENPDFEWQYAGRVETGKMGGSDPLIGGS